MPGKLQYEVCSENGVAPLWSLEMNCEAGRTFYVDVYMSIYICIYTYVSVSLSLSPLPLTGTC